jgi:hypothetical protein
MDALILEEALKEHMDMDVDVVDWWACLLEH